MQEPLESETTLSTVIQKEKINVVDEIEKIALESNIDFISAALELVHRMDWDPAWIAPYITGALKEKMRVEGEASGLLKKTSHPLMLFE
jgi:hypothetical protein